jgi:hypothetical protein
MVDFLASMIKHRLDDQGESLTEFFYALAIEKLTLRPEHLEQILDQAKETVTDKFTRVFILYALHKLEKKKFPLNQNTPKTSSPAQRSMNSANNR